MRVDWDKVRTDRIVQIDIDIKKAIFNKNYTKKRLLEQEKANLLQKIKKK